MKYEQTTIQTAVKLKNRKMLQHFSVIISDLI
jgi:hypothetical protein